MKAIFPGTFDPPTLGHLNLATRAASLCSHLIIAIGTNPQKKSLFSLQERANLWKKIIKIPHIEILTFDGLLVDFANQQNARFIIRGLRNFSDFESESELGYMNRMISGLETLFLPADEKYKQLSSTLLKEIAAYNKPLDEFIPQEILKEVSEKLK